MVETGNKFHDNVGKKVAWAHWFTFFNIVALCLISLRYIVYSGLADTPLGIAYQFVSLIGHFSFLSAVVFIILLFPLAFIITNNLLYRLISIAVATTAITFLIVDTQIFRLYQFHLNPFIWQFLQKPEQVEAIYSINLHYISIPITFTLELVFSYILWRNVRTIQAKQIGKPIALFLFVSFILSHLVFIWADATQYKPITHEKSLYPLSYPMTARTFLRKQGWLNEEIFERSKVGPFGVNHQQLKYPLSPLTYSTQPTESANDNLLIINIESLRADMLTKGNMPFLYSLSRDGITFKNHFSGANNSQQGVFSLFYSLPNSYWGAVTDNQISPVFMDKIKQQNRHIGLFSSIGFDHPEFLQSSFSQLKDTQNTTYSKAKNNDQVLTQWNKWIAIQENNKPWFSYVYLEQKNEHLFNQPTKTSIPAQAQNLALYQSQVMSIDKQIQTLIEDLKQYQQYDNSIIVITGTHGQSFKNQSNNDMLISGASVPLVIMWPNKEHRTIYSMTSHMDIVPTLMQDVFGIENKINDYSNGEYLFTKSDREYVLSGSINNYVIYENRKITKFSGNGDIDIIDWQGNRIKQSDDDDNFNITLLVDVLSKLRRFNQN
jgi:membrane-anchored protein YejM (alkaline phosphatase superfamily)